MAVKKKMHKSDLLINAFNFLKLMGDVESGADLAAKMKFSIAHISKALQPGKDVSEYFLLKFEKLFLVPKGYTLDDFEDMNKFLGGKNDGRKIESMLITKVTRLEGMMQAVLDKLDELKGEK